MPTIDLSTPPPPPVGLLEALPRRVSLSLPELRLVAERAGGAPLPFDVVRSAGGGAPDGRSREDRHAAQDAAYATALAALHDPATTLTRRGLVTDAVVDRGILGAVGLLATPSVALDLDVAVGDVHAKAWHRQDGDAVATLSTVDGIVFELAWFPTSQWPTELGRAAVIPEDVPLRDSAVPAVVDLPYELADAAGEAVRSDRADLLPLLAAEHSGAVLDGTGRPLPAEDVVPILAGLSTETQGRLRAMVADVSGEVTTAIGVGSWVLLADGWRTFRPHLVGSTHRVAVRRVQPADLAPELAPVLAEVTA